MMHLLRRPITYPELKLCRNNIEVCLIYGVIWITPLNRILFLENCLCSLHFLTCSIIIGNTPSLRSQDIDILRQSWCNGRLQNLNKFWILLYYVTLLGRYKSEYTEIQYSGVINSISKWIAYTSYFILPTTATRGLW